MSDIEASRIFWAVGSSFNNSNDDKTKYFIENKIWFDGYAADDDDRNIKILDKIKKGDILLIKSSSTKGTNHKTTFTKLKAIGIVIDKKNQYTFHIDWLNTNKLPIDFDNISYRKTIEEMRNDEMLRYAKEFINNNTKPTMNNSNYDKYINILKANHNLILTGAPGTGKTFLAKKIAETMDAEYKLVQFHPSYDYTDFVEGLRPIEKDGNIGFERKDGVFKEFCKRAIKNSNDNSIESVSGNESESRCNSTLPLDSVSNSVSDNEFEWRYNRLLKDIKSKKYGYEAYSTDGAYYPTSIYNDDIRFEQPSKKLKKVQKDYVRVIFCDNEFRGKTSFDIEKMKKETIENIFIENNKITDTKSLDYTLYRWVLMKIAEYKIENQNNIDVSESSNSPTKYVFIIDEINRGEVSKIFGELFYSIDPGYRGEKGKVLTQYQNLIEDNDTFKDGFYVPENVYIIGTMNDIDRSVESMDFAFRRRFAFVEIKAEDRLSMLDELNDESLKEKAINRLKNLNNAISKIDGLSSAYHIGASYFLKLNNYGGNFENLWNYHLDGLLKEYLRGMRDIEEKIKDLKKAYDNESAPNN